MYRIWLVVLILVCISLNAIAEKVPHRWAVYYTDAPLAEGALTSFDLIVLDSDSHPPLMPLKDQHKILLGYISIGEAESYRKYYKDIGSKGLLLEENPLWKGHRVIDVRKPEWTAYVLDVLVPSILAQGFDGIMMDTIDSVTDIEGDKYTGMQPAAAKLIKAIRARYPTIKIMLNRGFSILPQVVGDIDMIMAESVYTDWQPGVKKPVIQSKQNYQNYVNLLENARKLSPKLEIYTLDYWNPSDKKGVKAIYAIQRQHGFIPYVSTLNLQTINLEPQ